MRLLLDTHALLWSVGAPEQLGDAGRDALLSDDNEIVLSTASLWEIAIKLSLGRIELSPDWLAVIEQGRRSLGARWLAVEPAHCAQVAMLTFHHRDPFDRMLVAQAMCDGLTLVSKDSALAAYPISVMW